LTVPRLSIVVPAVGELARLEEGLVSVLQNRPDGAELLIVLNQPYRDPYNLAEEVRFIQAPLGAPRTACVNVGFDEAEGQIVHLLAAGAEVAEGWTDEPLARFDDPRVASVAPLVLDPADRLTVVSTGLQYRQGGVADRRPDNRLLSAEGDAHRVIGPSLTAGFYRKAAVSQLSAPLMEALGDLADVDLALSLAAAGWRTAFEPQSVVYAHAEPARPARGFAAARRAERLFLRHVGRAGWLKSLSVHLPLVAAECAKALPRPSALTQLFGRALAWAEWSAHRRHRQMVAGLCVEPARTAAAPRPGVRRDAAHVPLDSGVRRAGPVPLRQR
jgi:hypothetical protein